MSLQNFFEKHLQLHTLRIELTTGRVLIYQIDAQRKAELEEWMKNSGNKAGSLTGSFLSFYSDYDRFTFIRISAVSRIIFLCDPVFTVADATAYTDPFDILHPAEREIVTGDELKSEEIAEWLRDLEVNDTSENNNQATANNDPFIEEELNNLADPDIPDAIVLTTNAEPFLYYDLDEEVDYVQFTDSYGLNSLSLEGRFLSFEDGDGEQNYIPVENIICLDVSRRLVFPNYEWEIMERKRSLDNNTN